MQAFEFKSIIEQGMIRTPERYTDDAEPFPAVKWELSSLINDGLEQAKNGKTKPMKESIKLIRGKIQ
jgi:hypothetical protein